MNQSKLLPDTYALTNLAPAERPSYGFVEMIDGNVRVHTPTGEDVFHRRWHANGVLESECRKVNYLAEGVSRSWHDNGVLAIEIPFIHGIRHGIIRQFDRSGGLLGQYEMNNGRGLEFTWNEDGSLNRTYQHITKEASWGAIYDDRGKPHKVFLWNGKPISRKKWFARLDPVHQKETEAAEHLIVTDTKFPSGGDSPGARAFRAVRKLKHQKQRSVG